MEPMVVEFNKLVRDKIPEIITANGEVAVTRILDEQDYRAALLAKLVEKAIELRDASGDLDERADVAEVLRALDAAYGYNEDTVEAARSAKAQKRGGFDNRIFLESTHEDSDSQTKL